MSSKTMARMSRRAEVPPVRTSVLAVIAHPDDASVGLGSVLDAFVFAGVRVEVLCLTHGQATTLDEAPAETVAAQLNREFGVSSAGHQEEENDLRVTVDRARQRLASHADPRLAVPGSALWRRLELLSDTGSLCWFRPPRGVAGYPKTPARGAAQG